MHRRKTPHSVERLIVRIRQMLGRKTLAEIHDLIVGEDCDEETFFLCYQAAELMDQST